MKKTANEARLEEISRLLEEIAEDNTAVVGTMNRMMDAQQTLRADLTREVGQLRQEFAGALAFRALKDLCTELIPPLAAMEAMLECADFADPDTIRGHVHSLVITLRSVLGRMGAEKIGISPGEETFDPNRHLCVRLLTPEESPFPAASPRAIVRIVEDGYTLGGRILMPARVEVQTESVPIQNTEAMTSDEPTDAGVAPSVEICAE